MTNLVRAEQAAVAEIERVFAEAGWSDGWGLTDAEVRRAPSPLFYRAATPKAAADAKVVINGVGHSLYAVYNIIDPEAKYSGNQIDHFNITVAITLYYDDAYLFTQGSGFDTFLEELLSGFSAGLWAISGEGESAAVGASDKSPYVYRKVVYITNTF